MIDIWDRVKKIISKENVLLNKKSDPNKPSIIICAGIHGNEPLGVIALSNVIDKIKRENITISGNILAFIGNPFALAEKKRYLEIDLNRIWFEKESQNFYEFEQLARIKRLIDDFERNLINGNKVFIDLHTTSSKSIPFIIVSKNKFSVDYSKNFRYPVVVNLDNFIHGTLISFLEEKGYKALAFEGGFHEDENVIKHHEYLIWKAMVDSKIIETEFEMTDVGFEEIKSIRDKIFQIKYRHNISSQNSFKMNPGYKNFQKIIKGELLAVENDNEVLSPIDGKIFLPLYQQNGSEGFFIIQKADF